MHPKPIAMTARSEEWSALFQTWVQRDASWKGFSELLEWRTKRAVQPAMVVKASLMPTRLHLLLSYWSRRALAEMGPRVEESPRHAQTFFDAKLCFMLSALERQHTLATLLQFHHTYFWDSHWHLDRFAVVLTVIICTNARRESLIRSTHRSNSWLSDYSLQLSAADAIPHSTRMADPSARFLLMPPRTSCIIVMSD